MENLHKKFPAALLAVYFCKVLVFQPTAVDSGILLILASLAGFFEVWSQLNGMKILRADLETLTARMADAEKKDQELRTYVTSMKISQQSRGLSGR